MNKHDYSIAGRPDAPKKEHKIQFGQNKLNLITARVTECIPQASRPDLEKIPCVSCFRAIKTFSMLPKEAGRGHLDIINATVKSVH
ncbi:unnamed protein product [Allacma fusca]|uniref:Uncharacterized protein n=1 Tax=Allacma fusca TaxID=39272 RepID=A0A8J2L6X7_9HEXA|nr:unnamed protein product [Allacma fusca]